MVQTTILYQLQLAGKLAAIEAASADKMQKTVKEAIHKADYDALGERGVKRRGRKCDGLWNDTVQEQVENKKKAYNNQLNSRSNNDWREYRQRRKDAQRTVVKAKNEAWQKTDKEI